MGEANAVAAGLGRVVEMKNSLAGIWLYSCAMIFDRDVNSIFAVQRSRNYQASASLHSLKAVDDDVEKGLLEKVCVARYFRQMGSERAPDGQAPQLGFGRGERERLFQNLIHVERA